MHVLHTQTKSDISRHMIGDKNIFSYFTHKKENSIFYDDNNKWRIIKNYLLIENVKYNLLSSSQLYDKIMK